MGRVSRLQTDALVTRNTRFLGRGLLATARCPLRGPSEEVMPRGQVGKLDKEEREDLMRRTCSDLIEARFPGSGDVNMFRLFCS